MKFNPKFSFILIGLAGVAGHPAYAKVKMSEAQAALLVRTRAAAKATDEYVHVHPWQAVGVGTAVGVLVGLLIARR